jgi:hypothetical protein
VSAIQAATFPANRGMIEWEAVAARAWMQNIRSLSFVLPNVAGTMAIYYLPTDKSTAAALRNERLQIDLDDLLIEGTNSHHSTLIKLDGNTAFSRMSKVYGDPSLGDKTFDTILLECHSEFTDDDGSGIHYSMITDIQCGVRRGGRGSVFKGRLSSCTFTLGGSFVGSRGTPAYHFIKSQHSTLISLGTEGRSEKPQYLIDSCKNMRFINCGAGTPSEAETGDGVGNAVEFVNTVDCSWDGMQRIQGKPTYDSFGVKHLVVDENSKRNRFLNWCVVGSVSHEILFEGPVTNQNYGEFYDVSVLERGRQVVGFIGTARPADQVVSLVEGNNHNVAVPQGTETVEVRGAGSGSTVTGIRAGDTGEQMRIVAGGSTTVELLHDNTGSDADNRIRAGGAGGNLVLSPRDWVDLQYRDMGGTKRWYVVSFCIANRLLRANTFAAATTLGNVVGKIELFGQDGLSKGFVPVYDSIT